MIVQYIPVTSLNLMTRKPFSHLESIKTGTDQATLALIVTNCWFLIKDVPGGLTDF